jgi:predicted XRE-type DNA-binding protein
MAALPDKHWTAWSTENYQFRIAADFVRQLEKAMESQSLTQAMLAQRLNVTEGRVSQVLNNPGNLTLKKVIEYTRAVDYKVSVVAYYDGDPQNLNGPVASEIFATCWYRAGSPRDFFELQASTTSPVVNLSSSHMRARASGKSPRRSRCSRATASPRGAGRRKADAGEQDAEA